MNKIASVLPEYPSDVNWRAAYREIGDVTRFEKEAHLRHLQELILK